MSDAGGNHPVAKRLKRGHRRAVRAVARQRERDDLDAAARIDLDRNRLEHLAARKRTPLQIGDRVLHPRRGDVVCGNDDLGRRLSAGEGALDRLVRAHDRQRLRQVGEARQLRVQRERRQREREAARRPRARPRRPAGAARGRARSPRRATRRFHCRRGGRGTGSVPGRRDGPSFASSAGRIDSEPISATATISIAPTAIEVKTALPVKSIPAIAISTVRPGDEDRVPRCAGSLQQRIAVREAARPLLALAAEVEERVVDPDGHPDQQDHRLRRAARGDDMARERRETDRREHAREGEEHRQPRRDERSERDEQDDQRHRQRRVLGPLEVLAERLVQLVRRTGEAELGDREAGMPLLDAVDGVEDRLHLLVGLVLVAADLELNERRAPALRDLARVRGVERRTHPLHLRQAGHRPCDIGDDGAERRVADGLRLRLDEHALAGAIREAGVVEHPLCRPRPAGGGVGLLQQPRARDRAERDRDDAEDEPGRDGRLPVGCAPPPGARSDVEIHLVS